MVSAVLDRVVDGERAVLLVGEAETERIVPKERLPQGAAEGSWLKVKFDGERLVRAELDTEATRRAEERIARKMEKLRGKGRGL